MEADPDLRADAMAALARCARSEDALAIRHSLQSDPVPEVKIAAIKALARLKDEPAIPLLRGLVRSRCEAEVAWEELGSGWDDWLDVQVAAIKALGAIGAEEAVDDLLAARDDEEGQDLDHAVFAALALLPEPGLPALRGFLGHGDARVRAHALDALASTGGSALAPMRDALVRDPNPGVRRLAVDFFDVGGEALAALALKDPDASVRIAALARAAPARLDIARSALRDTDETARAVALDECARQRGGTDGSDLAANAEAWLRTAGVTLATVCARVLPALAGARSVPALGEAAMDDERSPEVRIAALRALGEVGTEEGVQVLRRAAVDRSRQVRLAALAAAAEMTVSGPCEGQDRARALLTEAVRGHLVPPSPVLDPGAGDDIPPGSVAAEPGESDQDTPAPDTGTLPSTSDDDASSANSTEPAYPRSTLDAIGGRVLAPARAEAAPPSADDGAPAPSRRPKLRPGRVAVEGPDDIGDDLRLIAHRLAAECAGDGIDEALAEAAGATTPALRAAAFEAIARRAAAMPLSPGLTDIAVRALEDHDPSVRAAAAQALATRGEAASHLAPLLDDPDDGVRAAAFKAVASGSSEEAARGCRDPSPRVRAAALEAAIQCGQDAPVEQAISVVVEGGFTDTLDQACRRYPVACRPLLAMLREPDELSSKALLMVLEAMSHAADREQDVPAGNGGGGTKALSS